MNPCGTWQSKCASRAAPPASTRSQYSVEYSGSVAVSNGVASNHQPCDQKHERRIKKHRIQAVEDAAVPREQAAAVLGAVRALEHRFGQIAQRAEDGRAPADEGRAPGSELGQPEMLHDERAGDGAEAAADGSLPGLAGRDALGQPPLSKGAPVKNCAGVVEPRDG